MCTNDTKIQGFLKNPNENKPPQKRQWSKWLSNAVSVGLANSNEKSPLNKSYWNTYHCADVVAFDENGKGISHYCKNRWCYTCNRIRTAKLIQGYLSQLQAFEDAHFVTLTRQTCSAQELPNRIAEIQKAMRTINDANRKAYKHLKGTSSEYKGLRKLECTLRPGEKYHAHLHLIVNTKDQAERIVKQWLRMHSDADAKAQDIRKADEKSHKELFKYFTKLNESKRKPGESLSLNYKRLDIVFCAMKGRQVFKAFGQLKAIQEDFEDEDLQATTNLGSAYANRLFSWIDNDWIDKETGELLIAKDIPSKVKALIPQTIEEKKAIEDFNYLPPVTTICSVTDAFDLEEIPTPWQPPNVIEERERMEKILNEIAQARPKKKEPKNTIQYEMAIT